MRLGLAACAGADPRLFDAHTFPEADEALEFCRGCVVVLECVSWVRPNRSFFDGVCGGMVWRNGYKVRADNSTREDRLRGGVSGVERG